MADVSYGVIERNIQVETRVLSYCPVCAVGPILMQNFFKATFEYVHFAGWYRTTPGCLQEKVKQVSLTFSDRVP